MLMETHAWEGWASTLLGSIIGATVVVYGLRATIVHERKLRREDREERALESRRTAAKALQIEIHNLRDIALSGDQSSPRDFRIHLLRECVMTTRYDIGQTQAYREVETFLTHVTHYRNWLRAMKEHDPTALEDAWRYLQLIDRDAEALMQMLHNDPAAGVTLLDYDQNDQWPDEWNRRPRHR